MLKFLNLQPELFGMDINDSFLRLAKLKKTARGYALQSFNEVPIKGGIIKEGVIINKEELIKIIRQACRKVTGKKLRTKHVIVSLPEEKSFSQLIQMPAMSQEELASAVPFEAENYIPISLEKVYLDFETVEPVVSGQSHISVLLNGIPKVIVDAYVDCLKKAGLIPCILEVEGQSIARALIKKGEGRFPVAIIDFGVSNTSLVIYSRNHIHFTCSIPISSNQLTQAIASTLKLSVADAEQLKIKQGLNKTAREKSIVEKAVSPILSDLAAQIKKYLIFYQEHTVPGHSLTEGGEQSRIEKIILCGGGANLKKLPLFLRKELKITVELGNPFANIVPQRAGSLSSLPYEKILSFTTALGLALRGAAND